MSRLSGLNSPLMLGFEHFERALDRVAKMSAEGYPPYNIEQLDRVRLRITLAVAGFRETDLSVHREGDQLVIAGQQREPADGTERIFLHRGIAARQFQRRFLLADGIEVEGATLENGLLHIDLRRPEPESRVQRITINAGESGGGATTPLAVESDRPNDGKGG